MAESENVYVKIGSRGQLLERTAVREVDHATLRALGWKLKGSKGAPTKKDETVEKTAVSNPSAEVPTSGSAQAAATDISGTTSSKTSDAGATADAKSQAAAGR